MAGAWLPSRSGFLGLPAGEAGPTSKADVVVVPFGLEQTVSYGKGAAKGPQAIIDASPQLEYFDEELWLQPHERYGLATLKPVKIKKPVAAALAQLEKLVEPIVKAGKFPLILGGEHALTPGAIRPFVKKFENLTILHFDAHADLRDGYEGEHYSHAAAMRRCLDFPGVRVVSVGIRNISLEEARFWEKNKKRVSIFWARDRAGWRAADIVKALGNCPVYLSFDVDAFDSSLMPATGTPEPGGLFWDDVMTILRAAIRAKKVVGADVVELAPQKRLHACDFVAAKLCAKILAYRFFRTPCLAKKGAVR